ncbi:hypothetical protein P4O66_014167, partial [Electrophorus voltai]
MAAVLNPDWLSCLPSSWSYGVTRDGRVFFINEEAKSTTWLHPVTGEALITGHRKTPGKRCCSVLVRRGCNGRMPELRLDALLQKFRSVTARRPAVRHWAGTACLWHVQVSKGALRFTCTSSLGEQCERELREVPRVGPQHCRSCFQSEPLHTPPQKQLIVVFLPQIYQPGGKKDIRSKEHAASSTGTTVRHVISRPFARSPALRKVLFTPNNAGSVFLVTRSPAWALGCDQADYRATSSFGNGESQRSEVSSGMEKELSVLQCVVIQHPTQDKLTSCWRRQSLARGQQHVRALRDTPGLRTPLHIVTSSRERGRGIQAAAWDVLKHIPVGGPFPVQLPLVLVLLFLYHLSLTHLVLQGTVMAPSALESQGPPSGAGHNERKVTCKHPVSGTPSQDNCIFVVNEQPTSKAPADEKKERPTSTMSEASNYTGGSDYTGQPCSPTARVRPSRSSKKVHNFGKRSNSIKRNPNAPVVKSNWLYKQDSTGMKMWKKRWFVLSDMCLFYYRAHGFSSLNLVEVRPLNLVEVHPQNLVEVRPLKIVEVRLLNLVEVRPMNLVQVRPLNLVEVRPMNLVEVRPHNLVEVRPLNLLEVRPLNLLEVRLLNLVEFRPLNLVEFRPLNLVEFCPMNLVEVRPLNLVEVCPMNLVEVRPLNLVEVRPMNLMEVSSLNLVEVRPMNLVEVRPNFHQTIMPSNATVLKTDEKEEGILGSILLPSFHISMLSVDDHISKKYAFKAAHPNMRTYYFCTDTAKEMESWMKVMTDAALVHTEPIRRLEKVKADLRSPQEMNNMLNHRVLTRPEIQNNERNRESLRQEDRKQKQVEKQSSTHRKMLQKDSEKHLLQKDGEKCVLQKDGDRHMLQKDAEKYVLQKDGERFGLQKDGEKYLLQKDRQRYTINKDGEKCTLQKDSEKYVLQKDSEQYLHREGSQTMPKERPKAALPRKAEKPGLQREGDRYGFQKEGTVEQPLTKINSIKLQPAQAAAIATAISTARQLPKEGQQQVAQVNGSGERSPGDVTSTLSHRPSLQPQHMEPDKSLGRTNSVQRLEQWARIQHSRGQDDDTKSITSYQTLPRNMPSHRTPVVPRYPEGYRTLPRNMLRPGSVCSVAGSAYDRALPSAATAAEKRRSLRDDTMWQLYEWQQRQTQSRLGYGTLPSPKTMGRIAESIPASPSHGSLGMYHTISPNRPLQTSYNPATSQVSSPVFRGDVSLERRRRAHLPKVCTQAVVPGTEQLYLGQYAYPPDRRVSVAQSVTPQSLQGKTPEELTLLLIKLRRQQAELHSLREHTLAQLMQLNAEAANPKSEILTHHLQRNLMYLDSQMNPDGVRENMYGCRHAELDVDAKLSRLCEQGKVVQTQEDKLQQLHREKHTLETALLSASQEIEMSAENPGAVQSVVQQRDVLQSGLLSTCRELSRVNAELDRSWREYDKLEIDVTLAKRDLLEQLEALGSPQTEPPSHQHVQIQKELWRIQDVMEALNKNKPKRSSEPGFPGASPLSSLQKSEVCMPCSSKLTAQSAVAVPSRTVMLRLCWTVSRVQESGCVPPRPPLPQVYEGGDRPSVPPPPCPSSTQPHGPHPAPHRPDERKTAQRNGSHSGPDYRLYKSEPELTTVAEVDESNGEEKSEHTAEKEPCSIKGVSFPVGVVSPRKKSPLPESSTIASYVTLRKSKKPDTRTDRPHSAVEHMSGVEGVRQRMSVEEQMERIRRHQQGAVRERDRKKEECLLSHSHSFSKENPSYYTLQVAISSTHHVLTPRSDNSEHAMSLHRIRCRLS